MAVDAHLLWSPGFAKQLLSSTCTICFAGYVFAQTPSIRAFCADVEEADVAMVANGDLAAHDSILSTEKEGTIDWRMGNYTLHDKNGKANWHEEFDLLSDYRLQKQTTKSETSMSRDSGPRALVVGPGIRYQGPRTRDQEPRA